MSHDSGRFGPFLEPVAKQIQQLAVDSLFLRKQGILVARTGIFRRTQNSEAARQVGDTPDVSPAAHLARPRRGLLQPLQRPAAAPACSALIVLEEKGAFRLPKWRRPLARALRGIPDPQRRCLGDSKTGRADHIRHRIHTESLSQQHGCLHPPMNEFYITIVLFLQDRRPTSLQAQRKRGCPCRNSTGRNSIRWLAGHSFGRGPKIKNYATSKKPWLGDMGRLTSESRPLVPERGWLPWATTGLTHCSKVVDIRR